MKEKLIKALQKTSGFIRAHKIRIAAGAVIIVLLLAGGITAVVLSQKEPSAKGAEPQNTVEKVADAEKPAEEQEQSKEAIQEVTEGEKTPTETTAGQNDEKRSQPSQNSSEQMKDSKESKRENPTGIAESKAENTKPAASGQSSQKKPIYKTIHHEAVMENRYVVDQKAWDEPIWKKRPIWVIADGAKFYSAEEASEYVYNKTVNGDGKKTSSSIRYEKYQDGVKHHPEQGHNETVVVKPAWDETVIIGWE